MPADKKTVKWLVSHGNKCIFECKFSVFPPPGPVFGIYPALAAQQYQLEVAALKEAEFVARVEAPELLEERARFVNHQNIADSFRPGLARTNLVIGAARSRI